MKTLFLFFFMIAGALQAEAQKLYASLENEAEKPVAKAVTVAETSYSRVFYSALRDYSGRSFAKTDEQLFGRDIACLLALLDEKFVRKEQIAAGDPGLQSGIRKPVVYNSVKNIAKHYKQKNRENAFTAVDRELFAHVVKVALACVDDDSADFEEVLKKSKRNPERQLDCFRRVELRNIYE